MVAGSYGPYGAFTTYRPPGEGFFIPPAMRVVANSNLNAFEQGPGGTPALAGADQLRTKLEQHWAISAFPIGNQRQVPAGVDHLDPHPHSPLESLTVLTSPVDLPDKTRRSLQQYDSPPLRVLGGNVFSTLVYSSSPSTTRVRN